MNKYFSLFKNREWFVPVVSIVNRDSFTSGARVLLALSIVFIAHWATNSNIELLPVLLGVFSSALAETDDHWHARLRSQLISLITFSTACAAVWLTLPLPLLLALFIAISAFVLTLLSALGDRYRAIAFGTLVLTLYASLSAHANQNVAANSIALLLIGAIWYGIVSVIWFGLIPQQPVQARLAKLYQLLGEYLQLKAQLLEPIREVDQAERRMALILQNGRVVNALNTTKESLLTRMKPGKSEAWFKIAMNQYLIAQDIHERTSSSHEDYQVLSKAFFHTDALYRCQRILILLGSQAKLFSNAIQSRTQPKHQGMTTRAIEDLDASIKNIEKYTQNNPVLDALLGVRSNLISMAEVFSQVFNANIPKLDHNLLDREPGSLNQAWKKITPHLTLRSPLFRHALRLSSCLLVGSMVMHLMHDHLGYWILLTILFVSQQQYAATHKKLLQRALGTAQGLAIGWALTQLFISENIESALIAILSGIFFGTRHTRYILATSAITALLVLSFQQIGLRQELFPARLWDTLIGCSIAGLAAWLILPNWQWRLWPDLAERSLSTQANYLIEILRQYQLGRDEHLAYRQARREAHNADAALSNAYSAMRKEPANVRKAEANHGYFLISSHTLLNYLSALGAHRNEWGQKTVSLDIVNSVNELNIGIKKLAFSLNNPVQKDLESFIEEISKRHNNLKYAVTNQEKLINTQLTLCFNLLPQIAREIVNSKKHAV